MRALVWERRWVVGTVFFLTLLAITFVPTLIRQRYVATCDLALAADGAAIARGDLARFVLSAPVLMDVAARLGLQPSADRIAALARVTFDSGSGRATIAAHSNDAKRSRAIADAFADATLAAYRALAQSRSQNVIEKLQRQSSDLRSKLRSYDSQIRVSARNDAQAAPVQSPEDLRRIAALEGQRAAVVGSLAAARAANAVAPAAPAPQSVSTPTEAEAPADSYPGIVVVKETPLPTPVPVAPVHRAPSVSETQLSQRIGAIDVEVAALRSRRSSVRLPSGNANRLRSDRDRIASAFDENRRALSSATSDRATALAALTVEGRSEFAERLIPPAIAAIVLAAAGVSLSIGAAYVAEAVDPRFRRSRHVERLYGKPHIGSV